MAESDMFPVRARGLAVRLGGHDALRGIDLDIPAQRRIAILGPNGAGKSVLLRTLHGLIAPGAGTITWGGVPVRPASQAMVFQRPVMLRRPALANIEFALDAAGVPEAEMRPRAMRMLNAVGLAHLAGRQARVLSGGEQQRVALARAWALEPRLLFLDEPTASLDPSSASEVESVVGEIATSGTTVVFSTHNLGFARRLAQDIVFLHEGRVTERSPVETFFDRPASREAALFLEGELPWNIPSPRF
jgi:tungstate transport system ATP-binding protein